MANTSSTTEVIRAYYIDKLSQTAIAAKFNLPGSHEIFRGFGQYYHEAPCSNCSTSLESKFANRTHSTETYKERSYGGHVFKDKIPLHKRVVLTPEKYKVFLPQCSNCGHYPDASCDCQYCSSIRETNRQKLILHYQEKLTASRQPVEVTDLKAKQLLLIAYFHTVCRGASDFQIGAGKQLAKVDNLDLPMEYVIENLKEAGVLCVAPDSIEQCVEMLSTTEHAFHEEKLTYHLPGEKNPFWMQLVKLHARSLFRTASSRDDVIQLWGELATKEAMLRYAKLSAQHSIPFYKSPNVLANLKRGIVEFGLFKTNAAISLSIRHASYRRREENITAKHAENDAQYMLNQWLSGQRELKPIGRHDEHFPEPQIVSIFIDYFLPFSIEYGLTELHKFSGITVVKEEA